jgi:hypothetical protein
LQCERKRFYKIPRQNKKLRLRFWHFIGNIKKHSGNIHGIMKTLFSFLILPIFENHFIFMPKSRKNKSMKFKCAFSFILSKLSKLRMFKKQKCNQIQMRIALTSGSILTGGRARNGWGFSTVSFQQTLSVYAQKLAGVSPAN